jgi:serine/threonine-protein kinase HipA
VKHETVAVVNGQIVGELGQGTDGKYRLRYDERWRNSPAAFPLSLSLPLTQREHGDERVRAYLWNLLPDNDAILAAWARRYRVSANNPLALLAHVGEECPGALQLLSPRRAEELTSASRPADVVEWLGDDEVGRRLRRVLAEPSAWREPGDPGQFSLAGAQPKIALLFDGVRWGIPSGRIPTTHILKPPALKELDGFAENEHVCLRLARALGLPAARSEVLRFGDQIAIVVERYDRVRLGDELIRLHQEDFCQALGIPPQTKYESQGGPSAAQMIRVVQERSVDVDADVATLVAALAFNWVIGGTDAHAKNYSHIMQPGGRIHLAPLYDLVSLLPYPEGRGPRVALAMKIGGEYRMRAVGRRNWERLAAEIGAAPDAVIALVREIVEALPDALAGVRAETAADGLDHPVLARLQTAVATNAASCLARLVG